MRNRHSGQGFSIGVHLATLIYTQSRHRATNVRNLKFLQQYEETGMPSNKSGSDQAL